MQLIALLAHHSLSRPRRKLSTAFSA